MATTPDPSYVLNSTLSAQIDKSGCITAVDVQVVEQACVDRKESFSNDILSMVYRPLRDRDHVSTEHPQIEIIREEGAVSHFSQLFLKRECFPSSFFSCFCGPLLIVYRHARFRGENTLAHCEGSVPPRAAHIDWVLSLSPPFPQ